MCFKDWPWYPSFYEFFPLSKGFIKILRGMYHGGGWMGGKEQCREDGGEFRKLC